MEFAPVAILACLPAAVLSVVVWFLLPWWGALLATFALSPWILLPAWMFVVERRGRG